jgi:hypothetical protein
VTVLLGAIAATTSRVRIMTGVTVLSILDPLRVAEDYATIDQLSRGRVELVIGKGNEMRQLPMFGVEQGLQWEQLAEKYELLRRLWREEKVTWEGQFRPPLNEVTSQPRPFAGAPRVWHGSATTLTSAALAAPGPRLLARWRVRRLRPAKCPGTRVKEPHQQDPGRGRAEGPAGMPADVGEVEEQRREDEGGPACHQVRNRPVAEPARVPSLRNAAREVGKAVGGQHAAEEAEDGSPATCEQLLYCLAARRLRAAWRTALPSRSRRAVPRRPLPGHPRGRLPGR